MTGSTGGFHSSTVAAEVICREDRLRRAVITEAAAHAGGAESLDARAFLDRRPELWSVKSVVLDLAYEEYCRKSRDGHPLDETGFCRRFGQYEASLRRLITVHRFLEENPDLMLDPVPPWPAAGDVFLGFALLGELGRGTYSRVFLAEEIALGRRRVVVKVTIDGTAEADVLGRLEHRHIVRVYSVRHDPSSQLTAICMPYLGRVTLHDLLDGLVTQDRVPADSSRILEVLARHSCEPPSGAAANRLRRGSYVDGIVRLGCELAEGLAYAHRQGFCHSDLKPSNILVTADATAMLLDFNLAFDAQAAGGRLGGTVPYMSPEHLLALEPEDGQPARPPGKAADLFSLGIILHQALSGRLPFGAPDTGAPMAEVRAALLERYRKGPDRLDRVNPNVEPRLARLIADCLAFEPEQRIASADALADALRESLTPRRRARRWVRRHSMLAGWAAALAVAGGLGTGYHLATRAPFAVRQHQRAVAAYDRGAFDESEQLLTRLVDSPEASADAFFWRGRARQAQGRIRLALEDYEQAARLKATGEIRAVQAYCYAREKSYADGIIYSMKALDLGFATAAVYNNLGYCRMQMRQFEEAIAALDEAICLDDGMAPAYHNRALAALRWGASDPRRTVDARAARDVEAALAAGPPSGQLYLDAVRVHERMEKGPGSEERSVRYLREALRHGAEPEIVRREFPDLVTESDLLGWAPPGQTAPETSRSADPLVDPLPTSSAPLF